ncbi:hypothetical protein GGR54DRAFT_599076 [Hypoxylon sp. NC1633]|nr:hypothetical protein GGR54DRAFT_599076 [Hypoxylon sp. NC1633]
MALDTYYTADFLLGLSRDEFQAVRESALADRVASYFTKDSKLTYMGVGGMGRHGGVLLFREADDKGNHVRKLVVKYSLDAQEDEHLRNETLCLEQLRGAEHIVQMIPLAKPEMNISGTGMRPTLALEFIPNGTLFQWTQRLATLTPRNRQIPSRLLWRIFLCFTRQIIGMSYPPAKAQGEPVTRENFGTSHSGRGITQNSAHANNFLFGDITPGDAEHPTPIVKLIDFGRGEFMRSPEQASAINTWSAAYQLMCLGMQEDGYVDLSLVGTPDGVQPYRVTTNLDDLGGDEWIMTDCHSTFLQKAGMDVMLRDLVARCMSITPEHTPTLHQLLRYCQDAVATRTVDDFRTSAFDEYMIWKETDEGIQKLLELTLFDGDIVDTPGLNRWRFGFSQMGTSILGLYSNQAVNRRNRTLYEGFVQQINDMRAATVDVTMQGVD